MLMTAKRTESWFICNNGHFAHGVDGGEPNHDCLSCFTEEEYDKNPEARKRLEEMSARAHSMSDLVILAQLFIGWTPTGQRVSVT